MRPIPRPFALALLLALAVGCDSLSASGDATLTGTVLDAATSAPIGGATVRVEGTAVTATTAADGGFAVVVAADSTGQPFTVLVTAPGYAPGSAAVQARVGEAVAAPLFRLEATSGGSGGSPSGPGTSITLDGRTSETVGVRGAGATETATLTFVVLDAQGRPVDASNAAELAFAVARGPGGGETVSPSTATTNANGRAAVTLTSGTRAGTVQVLVSGTIDGRALASLPVTITITGGLPDAAHFSLAPAQVNLAGYNRFGLTNAITAFVGDVYGNPVQPGTAIYFTTDGGLVGGSGVTSAEGTATTTLLSAAPLPSNAFACPGGTDPAGYATVTARTSDLNQAAIEARTTVLFSGLTRVEIVRPSGLDLGSYLFTVSDQFGHPHAPGTQITVAAEGVNVRATGDRDYTLGDHLCPGRGTTEFQFGIVRDETGPGSEPPSVETVSITVTSPNGNVRLTRSRLGDRQATRDQAAQF